MRKSIFIVMVLTFALTGCGDRATGHSQSKTLVGTKWKLEGVVDAKTGELRELDPDDDDIRQYRLIFDTDSTFSGFTSVNEFFFKYEIINDSIISKRLLLITKVGEVCYDKLECDGEFYWRTFAKVQSFSLQENKLRLYYDENKNYLLYKPLV